MPRRLLPKILIVLALLVAFPLSYAGYLKLSGNVHAVEDGEVFRSAQLDAKDLRFLVEAKGIRSIINLRGRRPKSEWYSEELDVARRLGLKHVSIEMNSRTEPDLETMRRVVKAIAEAPKPLLIHCRSGADRTGLAAALYEYAVMDRPAEKAEDQLSFAYGHFPWLGSGTVAMDRAFERFVEAEAPAQTSQEADGRVARR